MVTDPDVLAAHCRDWTGGFVGATAAVVRPASTREVAEVVRLCRATRTAIVPQGGNTGLVGGSVPLGGELVLSTERMVGVDDVDADSGQLTAWAGTSLAAVQEAADAAGWRYGVDLAARDSATIGGTVATNAGGLRVVRFGATRLQLLGVEAVLGTGDVVSRLGGLVKDNTGYDLAGLLCGSEGTLGIICRARLRLVPAPTETVTALVGFGSIRDAVHAVGRLRRRIPGLEAAELVLADGARLVAEVTTVAPVLDPIPPVQVVVEAVGPPDPTVQMAECIEALDGVTAAAVATDPARAQGLWHVREAHTEAIARTGVPRKYDVTLPAARLADFVEEIGPVVVAAAPEASTWVFGHLADGNVHVNVVGGDAHVLDEVVLAEVLARHGSVSAEHGIGTAKRGWLVRDRGPHDVAAMRAIKDSLDPDGIMNPGVLLP